MKSNFLSGIALAVLLSTLTLFIKFNVFCSAVNPESELGTAVSAVFLFIAATFPLIYAKYNPNSRLLLRQSFLVIMLISTVFIFIFSIFLICKNNRAHCDLNGIFNTFLSCKNNSSSTF
jgi:hypothetical protein